MPRWLELLIVIVTLPIWGLMIAVIALCLLFARPIFFLHRRPGLGGKPFTLIKFRTMHSGTAPDEERITPWGCWLRKTSLDELPELLNVLRGDMALVGPRPLLMEYLDEYTPEEQCRHNVRPGLTGWAQVHGRTALSLKEKLQYDLYYVQHRSFALDIKILWMTLFHLRGA